MSKKRITALISYCSNDFRNIGRCLKECETFADEVIVTVCDHFFSGKKENRELLKKTYALYPHVTFVEYAYHPNKFYGSLSDRPVDFSKRLDLWHATSRYVGFFHARGEYLLFLDSDEIVDGHKMKDWIAGKQYTQFSAVRFLQYFYIKTASKRLKARQIGGLFARKKAIDPSGIIQEYDRAGIFERVQGKKQEGIVGPDDLPMVHHYSWVKSKKERAVKLENKTEGKKADLENNFFHILKEGYTYKELSWEMEPAIPFFDPLAPQKEMRIREQKSATFSVDYKDLWKMEMEYLYGK